MNHQVLEAEYKQLQQNLNQLELEIVDKNNQVKRLQSDQDFYLEEFKKQKQNILQEKDYLQKRVDKQVVLSENEVIQEFDNKIQVLLIQNKELLQILKIKEEEIEYLQIQVNQSKEKKNSNNQEKSSEDLRIQIELLKQQQSSDKIQIETLQTQIDSRDQQIKQQRLHHNIQDDNLDKVEQSQSVIKALNKRLQQLVDQLEESQFQLKHEQAQNKKNVDNLRQQLIENEKKLQQQQKQYIQTKVQQEPVYQQKEILNVVKQSTSPQEITLPPTNIAAPKKKQSMFLSMMEQKQIALNNSKLIDDQESDKYKKK